MNAENLDESRALRPARRTEKLIVREVGDELVAYALDTEQVTALDPTTAAVWKHLDGEATIEEIAEVTNLSATEVAVAVDQLDRSGLMAGGVDRRRFLRFATASAGAMALVSIAAPAAMAAGSNAVLTVNTASCSRSNDRVTGNISGTGFPSGTATITVSGTSANPAGTATQTLSNINVPSSGPKAGSFGPINYSLDYNSVNLGNGSTVSVTATARVGTFSKSTTSAKTDNC